MVNIARYLPRKYAFSERGAVLEDLGRSHLLTRCSLVNHRWFWNLPRLWFLFLIKVVMVFLNSGARRLTEGWEGDSTLISGIMYPASSRYPRGPDGHDTLCMCAAVQSRISSNCTIPSELRTSLRRQERPCQLHFLVLHGTVSSEGTHHVLELWSSPALESFYSALYFCFCPSPYPLLPFSLSPFLHTCKRQPNTAAALFPAELALSFSIWQITFLSKFEV